jgi:hypothetical protein
MAELRHTAQGGSLYLPHGDCPLIHYSIKIGLEHYLARVTTTAWVVVYSQQSC